MANANDLSLHEDGTVSAGGAKIEPVRWVRLPTAPASSGRAGTAREAMSALARQASLRHLVVGVIGPRAASPAQATAAETVGRQLAGYGLTVICGGKTGVMEAVCKGCASAGGLAIGLLPGTDPDEANQFVSIALPTGLSEGRNMVIARASRVLIAIGGSYGTLSEVAYGLHFSKPVIGIEGAPDVEGVRHARDANAAVDLALAALIGTAQPAEDAANV